MRSLFKKWAALVILTLFIGGSSVFASGKMEVGIGQEIQLNANTKLYSPVYKWVVKKDGEIIETQSSKLFTYIFGLQGEYEVNLTASNEEKVEATTVKVLAGDRYPRSYSPDVSTDPAQDSNQLKLNLQTLPENKGGKVQLLGDGRLQFLLENSKGSIIEYRIDQNIFEDSDGNGVANDDIDNAADDSYLTGASWTTSYTKTSSKVVAQVTLVDQSGEKVSEKLEVIFGSLDSSGDLTASLKTLPSSTSEDHLIHLYKEEHSVAFYPRESKGKILEYRIDQNIFEDSDGDGDPSNDIDNLKDISFKTGDVFEVTYKKTKDPIIAQLIVVGEGGKGSRIQVGITFDESSGATDLVDQPKGIRLVSDKLVVMSGDPVRFTVEGLSLDLSEYEFKWDFDGDEKVDKETEGVNQVEHIYDQPGVYLVEVLISDQVGNSAKKAIDVVVKSPTQTKANFDYTIESGKVIFQNQSTVNGALSNDQLDYEWSFGDTNEESYDRQRDQIKLENPTYVYSENGTYLVTLVVTDSDGFTDTKTLSVELSDIDAGGEIISTDDPSTEDSGKPSLFIRILKVFFYLLMMVFLLVILGLLGLLSLLKIQHPDLLFEELIDELKVKILKMIGAYEEEDKPASAHVPEPPTIDENLHSDSPSEVIEPHEVSHSVSDAPAENSDQMPEPDLPHSQGPTPDWLKGVEADVNTPSTESTSSSGQQNLDSAEPELQVDSESDQTPSWLKNKEVVDAEAEVLDQPVSDEPSSDEVDSAEIDSSEEVTDDDFSESDSTQDLDNESAGSDDEGFNGEGDQDEDFDDELTDDELQTADDLLDQDDEFADENYVDEDFDDELMDEESLDSENDSVDLLDDVENLNEDLEGSDDSLASNDDFPEASSDELDESSIEKDSHDLPDEGELVNQEDQEVGDPTKKTDENDWINNI